MPFYNVHISHKTHQQSFYFVVQKAHPNRQQTNIYAPAMNNQGGRFVVE